MYIPGSETSNLAARSSSGITSLARSPAYIAAFLGVKSYASSVHQLQRRSIADSLDAVDLAICLCSVVGALFIIVPYCTNKHQRKLRHSLILGLATSDLISSIIIIATSSVGLAGDRLRDTPRFCTFAGYAFVVAIWTQHLWNLSIAIITYMILVHPISVFVNRVEKHIIWLWPAFWALSLLVNGIGWIVAGFGDVGGYCGFRPDGGGKYFAPVFYFVPRCLVVLTVLVLYTHLFFFLRRMNMFNKANFSSRQRTTPSRDSRHRGDISNSQHRAGAAGVVSQQSDGLASLHGGNFNDSRDGSWDRRNSSAGSSKLAVWRKWKKGSLNTSPSGWGSSRGNSESTQGKPASTRSPADEHVAIHTVEMVDYTDLSPKTKPAEIANEDSTNTTPEEKTQSMSDQSEKPITVPVPIIRPPPIQRLASGSRSTDLLSPSSTSSQPRSIVSTARRDHSPADDEEEARDEDEEDEDEVDSEEEEELRRKRGSDLIGWKEAFQPMAPRRDLRDFGMTSPPQEHLKHYALSPAGVDMLKRQKDGSTTDSMAKIPQGTTSNDSTYVNPEGYESMLGKNWTWGMQVGGGTAGSGAAGGVADCEGFHKASLTPTSPTTPCAKRTQGQISTNPDRFGQKSSASSFDENGVEALGSTLNRQASILLLLYPGVYCLLFSISIIRIIVDLTAPDMTIAQKMIKNKDALHSISRWTIFAQGAIDAIVFQLVERAFRARMKRQRRIAAGEAVDQPCFIHMWQKVSSLWRRKEAETTTTTSTGKTSTSQ